MPNKEGKLLLTAEDRSAAAFASVDRRLAGISRSVQGAGALMRGAIGTAPVTALLAAARAAIQHADAIGDQAKKVGLTTTAYQELSFAAKQLDVQQEQLDSALIKFRDRLGEARMGAKDAVKDFRLLGLDPRQFRSTDEAFAAVTRRLATVRDEFARTTIQTNLFGKSAGPSLTNFLSTSAENVAKLRREAHDLGAVLSEDTIAKADQAANKIEALSSVTKTQLTTALVELAPALVAMGDGFVQLARLIGGAVKELQEFADKSSEALAFGINVDEQLLQRNTARREAERRAAAAKDFTGSKAGQDLVSQFDKEHPNLARGRIVNGKVVLGPEAPPPAPPMDPEELRKQAEDIQKENDRQSKEVSDAEFDRINRDAEARQKLLDTYASQAQALAKLTDDQASLNEELAVGNITYEQYVEAINKVSEAYADLGAEEVEAEERMSVFADQAARNIQGLTANLISAAMAGENMADAIVSSLRRIAAELAAQAALDALFGAMAKSENPYVAAIGVAGQSIGKRAGGGPVAANDPYVVGEKGPELMIPRTAGYIVPNHKLAFGAGAGGPTVNITNNINAPGASAEMLSKIMRIVRESEARTKQQIFESLRRNTAPI
jgi:hypothetical protein